MGVWFGSVDDDEDGEMGDGELVGSHLSSQWSYILASSSFAFLFNVYRSYLCMCLYACLKEMFRNRVP